MAISEQTPQETPNIKGTSEKLEELHRLKEEAMLAGGIARIEAQHKKGKLTLKEREIMQEHVRFSVEILQATYQHG